MNKLLQHRGAVLGMGHNRGVSHVAIPTALALFGVLRYGNNYHGLARTYTLIKTEITTLKAMKEIVLLSETVVAMTTSLETSNSQITQRMRNRAVHVLEIKSRDSESSKRGIVYSGHKLTVYRLAPCGWRGERSDWSAIRCSISSLVPRRRYVSTSRHFNGR